MRAVIAGTSLALIVAAGVAIAIGSASPDSALVRVHNPVQPTWLAGPLEALDGRVTFAQFLVLEASMAVGYLSLILSGVELRRRSILAAIAVLHVAFLLAPPLLSSDLFNYLDYARLGARHGIDPYTHGPIAAPLDPAFAIVGWKHAPSAYGPLFTVATYPLAFVGVPLATWLLKLAAACASLGCVALVYRIAGQLGRSPVRAAAAFGLNPILLVWTVGGGHNDLLMLMLALAAVSLVISSREAMGGAALAAAAAVKATAGLALPFLLLGARRGWRFVAGLAAAAAAVIVMAGVAFPGHALGVVNVLEKEERLVAFDGLPNVIGHVLGLPGATPGVRHVVAAVFVVAVAWLAVRVRRGYDWVSATGWAMLALVLASPWLLAWYTVWPLPFAAVSRDRRLLWATLLVQAYFLANHIPDVRLLPHTH